MNSSLSSFIIFSWLYFLLMVGKKLTIHAQALTVNETTEAVKVPINTDLSLILWKGTEMWESGKHEGTVNLKKGYLSYMGDQIVGGHFIADMSTIAVTDIPKHEPVLRRRLRNHLKSEDFLYVKKYPTAEFEITSTKAMNGDNLRVWGNLSIRDVTKSISFVAYQKSDQKSGLTFYATFKIDRFAWNISYQGSYWDRITSILDNTFVDADISLSVQLISSPIE